MRAELKRIVHRRRDKVGGHHQGRVAGQLIDPGVVAGLQAHQKPRLLVSWQGEQHFIEPDRVDFGCSAAGFGQSGQGRLLERVHESQGNLLCANSI